MAITSLQFMSCIFVLAIVYFLCNSVVRKVLLIAINVLFYLSFRQLGGAIYLLLAIALTYSVGYLKAKHQGIEKNVAFISVMSLTLGLLICKYMGFFFSTIQVDNPIHLVAPVGISFYTFKMISYVVDVHKGKIQPVMSFWDYFIYVTLFTQITAGPIERADHFIPQLDKLGRELSYNELKSGLVLFAMGAFEKVVIADRLGLIVNKIYGDLDTYTGFYVVIAIFFYAFQIYCDFDGYSNMAIGLGKLFGLETMQNFKTPYLACNMSDFWRRWHITLSSWFRDYVYIPLGGNRKGTIRKYANVMIVSLLSGLWHGASFGFVIWGFLHGLVQIIASIFHSFTKNIQIPHMLQNVTRSLSVLLTFVTSSFLFLFFRVQDMESLKKVFQSLRNFTPTKINVVSLVGSHRQFVVILGLIGIVMITDVIRSLTNGLTFFNKQPFLIRWIVYIAMIFGFVLFAVYGPEYHAENFIYLQF